MAEARAIKLRPEQERERGIEEESWGERKREKERGGEGKHRNLALNESSTIRFNFSVVRPAKS